MDDIVENGVPAEVRRRWWLAPLLLAAVLTAGFGLRHVLTEPAMPAAAAPPTGTATVPSRAIPPGDATSGVAAPDARDTALAERVLRDRGDQVTFAASVRSGSGIAQSEDWDASWLGRYTVALACAGEGSVVVTLGRTREAAKDLTAGVRVPCTATLVFTAVELGHGCLCARIIPGADTDATVAVALRRDTG